METNSDIFAMGEPAKVTPVIVNESGDPATYTMAYVIKVFDYSNTVIWEREIVVYGKITIPAFSEGRLDAFVWDQRDKEGGQVSQGRYRIFIRLFEYRYSDIQGEKEIIVR